MRVTHHNNRVVISCSLTEFEILSMAVDQIEAGDPREVLTATGHRRSWARRTNAGQFLRVDKDRRTDEYVR